MAYLNRMFIGIFDVLKIFIDKFVADPGNQWSFTIILFTLLFNLLMLPINIKQMKSMQKTQALQAELDELKKKYKNDPKKMQEMQMKLYEENNISMFGGCLPLLITYPLFIAMFGVFRQLVADGTLTGMRFTPIIPDLAARGNIILSILSVLTMLGSTYVTTLKNKKIAGDNKAAGSANTMQYVMSLFFGYITYTTNAALGLYWVTGNLFRMIQGLALNAVESKKLEKEDLGNKNIKKKK